MPSRCGSQELKTKRIFYVQIKSALLSKIKMINLKKK